MNTARKVFLVLFALSTLAVLVLFVNLRLSLNTSSYPWTTQTPLPTNTPVGTQEPSIVPTTSPETPEVDPSQNSKDTGFTALIGSIITSVTSLIGFVTTTVITWRKERREASLADVERKKLETELEKSRLELERLKKGRPKKKKK